MPDSTYTAALDTSSSHASFAVRREADGVLLIADHETPVGRHSAGLMGRLLQLLDEASVPLNAIGRWTIGMGPGSFTGIRVGAALVKGICAGNGAKHRGLPSSLAMACQAGVSPVTVLHDGRRQEMLATTYHLHNGSWQPTTEAQAIRIADLAPAGAYAMLADDRSRQEVLDQLGDAVRLLPRLEVTALLNPPGYPWPTSAEEVEAGTDPIYVRPAVFVEPRPLLTSAVVTRLLHANPDKETSS